MHRGSGCGPGAVPPLGDRGPVRSGRCRGSTGRSRRRPVPPCCNHAFGDLSHFGRLKIPSQIVARLIRSVSPAESAFVVVCHLEDEIKNGFEGSDFYA